MRRNHNTNRQASVTQFALGQTFITAGAEGALEIAGQTAIEFLRRHMSCDWGELSDDDVRENELSLKQDFRLLSNYQTGKGQRLWIITEADRSATLERDGAELQAQGQSLSKVNHGAAL